MSVEEYLTGDVDFTWSVSDCEEEQFTWSQYIQLVFGTDYSFTIQEGTFSKKGILGDMFGIGQ